MPDQILTDAPRLIQASKDARTREWREQCIEDAIKLLNLASWRTHHASV